MWVRFSKLALGRLLTALLVVSSVSISLTAQTSQGVIAGVVLDPTGATVSGAKVDAKNEATGVTLNTMTTADGNYRFAAVPAGVYDITVTSQGFKTETRTGVRVQVSATTAADFNLTVGTVTEAVTVAGEATAIQSESADVGTVIDNRQEIELPLALGGVGAMRSPEAFVFLTPGATGPGTGNSNNGIFISKIGGGQNFGNEILLDGIDIERTENGSSFDEAAPSVEAIREFRVITSTIPAEYGRTTGGVESFITKSGTNAFHGTAYDIFRNEDLDANGWFNNHYLLTCAPGDSACRDRFQRPRDRKNDYGVNLGGPVWIPKLYNGKDKTFFFFNWEQYQQSVGSSIVSTLPTAAERNGDFSALLTNKQIGTNPCTGQPVVQGQIFDPTTTTTGPGGVLCRQPFPGNVIPSSQISQVSKNFLALLPQPNTSAALNNYSLAGSFPLFNTAYEIRIDHNISQNSKFFASYHSRENARYVGGVQLPAPIDPNGWNQDFITHYGRFGWDYVFSPTVLNELTIGYNRTNSQNFTTGALQARAGNFNWGAKLGIANVCCQEFPIVTVGEGFPNLGRANNDFNVDNGERLEDQVSWTKGKHSLAFGVDLRNQLYSTYAYDNDTGTYNFARAQTAATPTLTGSSGNGFASFLIGDLSHAARQVTGHVGRWTMPYFAVYVKDDYKARPNLTFNLGLRWDVDVPRVESHNDTSNFSPTTPNPGAGGRPGAMVFGTNCHCNTRWADTYYKDFGPRFGFAWTPSRFNNGLVVRGGYGIYYAPLLYTDFGGNQQQGYSATPSFSSPDAFSAAFNWTNGFPATPAPPFLDPTLLNGQSGANYIAPQYGRPGMIQNWSIQVQKQLGKDMVATVGYVGSTANHLRSAIQNINNIPIQDFSLGDQLLQNVAGNTAGVPLPYPGFKGQVQQALRPFPQYQWIYTDTLQNLGHSSYEALQATLERRFAKGLSVQASFAWQKNITDSDSALPGINAGVNQIQNPQNLNLEKAISQQDVPIVFTAAWLYELPFGHGKHWLNHGIGGAVLGGWQLGGVQRYQSGAPVSFGCANGIPGWDNCIRFSRNVSQSLFSQSVQNGSFDPFADRYYNPAAFYDPNAGRSGNQPWMLGTMPRVSSDARMQPYLNEDFSIIRNFRVREPITMQLKAELLNAFNRHLWSPPDTGPNSPTFGLVNGTIDGPRNVQFTLRLLF